MARAKKPKYRVLIWSPTVRRYIPAPGVKAAPYGQFTVRKALRKLEQLGHRLVGHAVLVERIDVAREGRPARGKVIED